MATTDDQSDGQGAAWDGPRRRYYPVRGAPTSGPPSGPPAVTNPSGPPAVANFVAPQGLPPSNAEAAPSQLARAEPGRAEPPGLGPARRAPARSERASLELTDLAPGLLDASLLDPALISSTGFGLGPEGDIGPGRDLAATVLAGLGALTPASAAAPNTSLPARRQVDVSVLSTFELRREAASCIDDNIGRAKRVISDWLKS